MKTHAQVELSKLDNGVDIFEELDEFLLEMEEEDELENEVPYDDEKKKAPKRKTPKQKTPKNKKTPKAAKRVASSFILSPVDLTKNNDKTPVISNRSSTVPCPPTLSFSSSSSVITSTMTTSTFGHFLPRHHLARSMGASGFQSLSAAPTDGRPSSYHLPLNVAASQQAPNAAPTVYPSRYVAMLNGVAPTGSIFGIYEAANALLFLSTSHNGKGF